MIWKSTQQQKQKWSEKSATFSSLLSGAKVSQERGGGHWTMLYLIMSKRIGTL